MALIWAHGFESGVDYAGYENDESNDIIMNNEGWRVYCGAAGAPADATIFNSTKYLFTGVGPVVDTPTKPTYDFYGSYSMNMQYDNTEVGPVSITEGTVYGEIAVNFSFAMRQLAWIQNSDYLIAFVHDNSNYSSRKTLGFKPTNAGAGIFKSTFDLYLKDVGAGLSVVATTTSELDVGVWYNVAIHFKHDDTTNKTTAHVYVNEKLECSATVTNTSSYNGVQRFEFGNVGSTIVSDPGTWVDSITCWDAPSTDPFKKPYYIFGLQPAKDGSTTNVTAFPTTAPSIYSVIADGNAATYGENIIGTSNLYTPCDPISSAYETDFGNRDIKGIALCGSVNQGHEAAGDKTNLYIVSVDDDRTNGQNTTMFNGYCTGGWMMRHQLAPHNPYRAWSNSVNGTSWDTRWVRADLDSNTFGTKVYNFGASTGSKVFKVAEACAEVVWGGHRDDVSASTLGTTNPIEVPESYIIWPGPETTDVNGVAPDHKPSQHGPFADVAYPEKGNSGSMLVFQHGAWDRSSMYTEPQAVQYSVSKGGSVDYIAEYVWKNEEDPASITGNGYRGYQGLPYIWGTHSPYAASTSDYWWTMGGSSSAETKNKDGLCIGYSSLYNRLFYIRWGLADSNIVIRYRSTVGLAFNEKEDDSVWSQYKLKNRGSDGGYRFPYNRRLTRENIQPSLIELPDGTLQLYHFYTDFQDDGQQDYNGEDFMIFQSNDGGLTWILLTEQVLRSITGNSQALRHAEVAVSGDWIRIDMWAFRVAFSNMPLDPGESDAGRQTMVSSDRGATWKVLYERPDNITDDGWVDAPINPCQGSGIPTGTLTQWQLSPNYYATAAIAGIGDDSGTFIRIRSVKLTTTSVARYTMVERASRDEKWALFSSPSSIVGGLPQACGNPIQLQCTAGGGFVYAYAYGTEFALNDPALQDLSSLAYYQIPLNAIDDYRWYSSPMKKWRGSWGTYGAFGSRGGEGLSGQAPAHMRSCWAGDRIARFYRTVRTQEYWGSSGKEVQFSTDALSDAGVADFIGGWTQLPLRGPEQFNPLFRNHSAVRRWTAGMGYWGTNTTFMQNFVETTPATGSNSFTWNTTQMCVDHSYYGGSSTHDKCTVYTTNPVSGLSNFIMDHGVIGMTTRRKPSNPVAGKPAYGQPTSFSATAPAWGMRLRSGSTTFNSAYSGNTQFIDLYLSLAKDGSWAIWDAIAGSTLYESTIDGYGFSSAEWFEFRLAFANSDQLLQTKTSLNDDLWWVKLLYKIEERDVQFVSTPLLTLTTTSTPSWGQHELVGWGSFDPDSTSFGKFQYKELFYQNRHTCNLIELDRTDARTYRGAPINSSDYAVGSCGYQARWGGAAAFWGDAFTGGVEYQYGIRNLNAPSPSQVWRTQNESTAGDIKFQADVLNPDTDTYYNHNAIAILNCNVRKPILSYAATTSFSGSVDYTLDLTKHLATVTGITSVGNYFTVTATDADKWEDNQLVNMYADVLYNDGTQQTYKVRRNTGNRVYLAGLTQSLTNNMSPLDTVAFFDGYGATVFGGSQGVSYKAMRLQLPAVNTSDGYLQLGGYVAGMTLPLNVPLEWDSKDEQTPNVQLYTSDRGTVSAYKQGKARLTFQGKIVGDANKWRDGFRGLMNQIVDYSKRPVVLVTDHNRPNNNMLYCRYNGPTSNENVAWKYNPDTAQWEKVGDLGVEFVEEV